MIFVDTSAWYADLVGDDANHSRARDFVAANEESLVTTDYIVAETLNLLVARGYRDRAAVAAEEFFSQQWAAIEWVRPSDIERAREVLAAFHDKAWSFTDCVSFAVIERLRLKRAFAFDRHFQQFGTVQVLP